MISNHLKSNLNLLKAIPNLPEKTVKKVVASGDRSLIISICEICLNLLSETFSCTPGVKRKLKRYKHRLTKLAERKKLSKNCRIEKNLINRNCGGALGGFLSVLIPPALEYIYHQIVN